MLGRILFLCLLAFASQARAQDSTFIYFEFDRHELTEDSRRALDAIFTRPKLYSTAIFGHTDQFGSETYNNQLSLRRANAVKDYLAAKGLSAERISILKGFGESMPAIDRLDAASRQKNRRVVVVAHYEITTKDSVIIDNSPPAVPQQNVPVTQTPVRKPVKENLITELTDTATKAGDNLILKNINFYGGRHVFLPEAYPALHELLHAMQTIPTLEIEIQGHICCHSDEGDGMDIDTGEPFLSYNRARAVFEYLAAHGIDRKRMTFKGFGHRFPIIETETTEEERTTNRRVEIRILKK